MERVDGTENNLALNLLIFSAATSGKAKQTKWPNHPQSGVSTKFGLLHPDTVIFSRNICL